MLFSMCPYTNDTIYDSQGLLVYSRHPPVPDLNPLAGTKKDTEACLLHCMILWKWSYGQTKFFSWTGVPRFKPVCWQASAIKSPWTLTNSRDVAQQPTVTPVLPKRDK